jgi:hypothetical protein
MDWPEKRLISGLPSPHRRREIKSLKCIRSHLQPVAAVGIATFG